MQKFTQMISKLILSFGALFFMAVCFTAAPAEAEAYGLELNVGIGYNNYFSHHPAISIGSDDPLDGALRSIPGGSIMLELGMRFHENFAATLEADLCTWVILPNARAFINAQGIYQYQHFEFAAKVGLGIHAGMPALQAGLRFYYLVDEHWAVGVALNYIPVFQQRDDCDDVLHQLNAMFQFSYRF